MTLHHLMAGYSAYTDATELAAARGSYKDPLVTTTGVLTTTSILAHDLDEPGDPAEAAVLLPARHTREYV
jgi:hypothetical protein